MNLKTSFTLAIVFLVLGTFALFDPLHTKEKREEAKEKEGHVFWLKDEKVEWFALNANNVRTQLTCTVAEGCSFDSNGAWSIKEPIQDSGDAANIGSFLSSLKNLAPVEQVDVEASASLAEFGLDKPQMVLEFKLKGAKEISYLKFGSSSAIGSNTYAYASASPTKVSLIASFFSDQVKKPFFYWRNKKLFPTLAASDVKFFSWKNAAGKIFSFERKDSAWQMLSPLAVGASQPMLDGLVNSVLFLQTESVEFETKDSPEARKLLAAKPALQVFLDKEKKQMLSFYKKAGAGKVRYYATAPDRSNIVLVDGAALNRFDKELIEFRNRKLLSVDEKNRIQSIELTFPREQKTIVLERNGTDWKRVSGEDVKSGLSQTRIKNTVDALAVAQVQDFISQKKSSAWKQAADLEMLAKDAEKKVLGKFRFVVSARRAVLSAGEVSDELRSFGEDFAQVLPIRINDLEESSNKKVITQEKNPDGHGHHEHLDTHEH